MPSELEKASALVGELEAKRAQHVAKAEKRAAERDEIALGAFTGNGKQRERVDEIHTTLAKHSSELAALDSALKSAHQRVADRRGRAREAKSGLTTAQGIRMKCALPCNGGLITSMG
jgi:chromosome segregation ATPase